VRDSAKAAFPCNNIVLFAFAFRFQDNEVLQKPIGLDGLRQFFNGRIVEKFARVQNGRLDLRDGSVFG
jgi:hypothetical protein